MLLFTDASKEGWGAHLLNESAKGKWSPKEKNLHINVLELMAIQRACVEFVHLLRGNTVALMCDNATVVAYVKKQGGLKSKELCSLTIKILEWAAKERIEVTARFIPGKRNVLADGLSRMGQVVGSEWSLHPEVAQMVILKWGSPIMDLFATKLNAQCPVFCSPVPDPTAAFEDAFQHYWDNLDVYAFLPFGTLWQVLNRVRRAKNLWMTLVAPWWPEREWFADLKELALLPPWPLPGREDHLRQPHFQRFHENPRSLRLHAWRLLSGS
ncbi:uncharacterized protein [Palaemon carinicauda]|uniref:uncharacterized protein n=1 Tax=Palaemon carinicauda TaxID=392227 RepID=UPI0035B58A80